MTGWDDSSLTGGVAAGGLDLDGIHRIALSALGLSGLALGIWSLEDNFQREPPRTTIVSALGAVRLSEGRFTGGFPYASLKGSSSLKEASRALQAIRRDAAWPRVVKSRPDFAIIRLADGKINEALRLLQEEAKRYPRRADIQSDLAAAWLTSSRTSKDPFDYVKALDAADRAVRLDPMLSEAWFNLAVAAQRLFLRTTVVRAWVAYLTLDNDSPWAQEGRARLAKVKDSTERQQWERERLRLEHAARTGDQRQIGLIVERFTLPVRLWVQDELLPRWAEAELAGEDPSAQEYLKEAAHIAAWHEKFTGDSILREAVDLIGAAHGNLRKGLAYGHWLLAEGNQALKRHEPETAEGHLLSALGALKQGNSPFALLSELSLAICHHDRKDFEGARVRLKALLQQIDAADYPSLVARAQWIIGLTLFAEGEPTLSLRHFHQALDFLEGTGALEDEGALNYLIAANLSYLGSREESWSYLYKALAATPQTLQERRLFTAFDEAGTALARVGEVQAALYFRDEVVSLSRVAEHPDPTGLEHAYLRRAESRWQAGNGAAARADLRRARWFAERIGSTSVREAALAEVNVAEGEATVPISPQRAFSLLGIALDYYLRFGTHYDLPRIYLGRYQALMGMGRLEEAALDLAEGIGQYERVREKVGDESSRHSYFDQAQQLFDMMIKLQVDAGRPKAALGYTERARARDLLDLRASVPRGLIGSRPLEPDELASRLPRGVALVEFASLEDRLFAWVVRKGRINSFSLKVTEEELSSWIRSIRSDLEAGNRHERLAASLEDLYDRIIRPLEPALVDSDQLVIVPDKAMFGLPFAALRDRTTKHYLIETRGISISPSASFYVEGTSTKGVRIGVIPTLLAVGASEFDRTAFAQLSGLSRAEKEAEAVADLYPTPMLLVGPKATKRSFVAEAVRHDVIHFAGHTVSAPESPHSSMMLFSPSETKGSGLLQTSDLYKLDFRATRVVVLSSCSTGLSSGESAEGRLGLVRPFLARGVGAVVASLWDVPDRRAPSLALAFHRHLRVSRSPTLALREAQVALIRSGDLVLASPSTWAVLQMFGSDNASISSDEAFDGI